MELQLIDAVMNHCRGNKSRAVSILDTTEQHYGRNYLECQI